MGRRKATPKGRTGPLVPVNKRHAHLDPLARHVEKRMKRDEIAGILQPHAVENPRISGLINLLLDPDYRKVSLGKLCEKMGISTHEVVDHFRKTKLDQALLGMYDHVPEILEDTAIDAKSVERTCWKCFGEGEVKKDKDTLVICPECAGSKRLRKPGDSDARKLVFETAGLAGKRGPSTAIQLNVAGGGVTIEDVSKKTEEVLSGE